MLKIHHPFTLEGKNVILRPPLIEDFIGLSNAAKDGEIWNNPFSFLPHSNEMSKYLQELLDDIFDTISLPLIIVHKPSNTALLYDSKNI